MSTRKIWTSFHFLIILIILWCSVLGVHASYELETIYDGVTEYTSEITHNGGSVIKLLIPEEAKTSSGAIVRTPVNIPFNTFESFSNYISYYSARPRFLIYLDTTGNNEVDIVLMSDYQDFGDGEFLVNFNRWIVECNDFYDWNKILITFVQLFGNIKEEDFAILHDLGYAHNYSIIIKSFNALNILGFNEICISTNE